MNSALELTSPKLHLILAERPTRRRLITALAARLALAGPVRFLDGGNSFDGYGLARLVRGQSAAWQAALGRVLVSRAFTCYQVQALLAETASSPLPTLAPELLDTFYDESVPLPERRRLLEECLTQLRRISQAAPVAVSAGRPPQGGDEALLEMLVAAAGQVWSFEAPAPAVTALRLL